MIRLYTLLNGELILTIIEHMMFLFSFYDFLSFGVIELIVLAFIFCVILQTKWARGIKKDYRENAKGLSPIIKSLLGLAVLAILFAAIAPLIFTRYSVSSFLNLGNDASSIGTAIGGVAGPFIATAAVIVTGLAFYVQYQANQQIKKQFKIQQFESQFYEMLKLHKENVNEFEIRIQEDLKNEPQTVKGRKVFLYYLQEFNFMLSCVKDTASPQIDQESFSAAYYSYFHGKDKFKTMFEYFVQKLPDRFITSDMVSLNNAIEKKEIKFREGGLSDEKYLSNYFPINQGHSEYLSTYYRHLYMIVKYVVEAYEKEGILDNIESCMKYLKVLRVQLSNAEQTLLFYNWIAGLEGGMGGSWESDNKGNNFFTKYYMLHNLPFKNLFEDQFLKNNVQSLLDNAVDEHEVFENDVFSYLEDK